MCLLASMAVALWRVVRAVFAVSSSFALRLNRDAFCIMFPLSVTESMLICLIHSCVVSEWVCAIDSSRPLIPLTIVLCVVRANPIFHSSLHTQTDPRCSEPARRFGTFRGVCLGPELLVADLVEYRPAEVLRARRTPIPGHPAAGKPRGGRTGP